jgi:PAS domain S-box-containing protein
LTTYSEAFDARRSFEMECRQRRRDGEWRVVLGRGKPMYAPDGTFLGYIGTCIDVTERKQAEARRERLLLERITDYAVFWLTPSGHVASWNAAAEQLTQYRTDEILGQHFSWFFPLEDVQAGKPERLLRMAATQGRAEDQDWRLRKDRERFWANVIVTELRDDSGRPRAFAVAMRDISERKRIEDDLVRHVQELARLSAEQLEMLERLGRVREQRDAIERERLLEDERKRIARDLHDNVEQAFFAIGLTASASMGEVPESEAGGRMVEALVRVNELATNGVTQLRAAIFALNNAEVVGRRLVPSLQKLARDFRHRTGVEADVIVTGGRRRLPTKVAETLYAAAREALSNVERHSTAGAVVLGLHIGRRHVTLSIQDDGTVVPPTGSQPPANVLSMFGLRSVRDHVLRLDGMFDAGPNPDGGFLVRTRLPLGSDTDSIDSGDRSVLAQAARHSG